MIGGVTVSIVTMNLYLKKTKFEFMKYVLMLIVIIQSCTFKKEHLLSDYWRTSISNDSIGKVKFNIVEFKHKDKLNTATLYFAVYKKQDSAFVDSIGKGKVIVASSPYLNYDKITKNAIWKTADITNSCFIIKDGNDFNVCEQLNSIIDSVLVNKQELKLSEQVEIILKSKYK